MQYICLAQVLTTIPRLILGIYDTEWHIHTQCSFFKTWDMRRTTALFDFKDGNQIKISANDNV